MKKLVLSVALFAVCFVASAQSWQDTVGQIEKIFARYKPGIPGAELAIARYGKVIFSKASNIKNIPMLNKRCK